MVNKIDIKHSNVAGVVPTTSSINLNEIAFNTVDGKAYFKRNNGTASIKEFIATPHSGSFILSGSQTIAGYMQFMPVTTNINTSISASYIYVSGSTNDLYFSQNGSGYNNVTRLRWLESNLYTGLLHGGIISASIGGTTFTVASGSGIIVNLNTSTGNDPYPTVQFLTWPNLTASIASLSASYDQQFVAINSAAQIFTQGIPYNDGDYNTKIPIGIVIHQNHSTINAAQTFPGVGYGWKQRSFDFIKAFGPLKISGYTLQPSSSLGLLLDGGISWVDGRNYTVDPNNPSYITEAVGIATSKIYYYYQTGSEFNYLTNNGAGYTSVTASLYSNNGVLTALSTNNKWSIQRVYYFPNSATKALYVYYGNAQYDTYVDALAGIQNEAFLEAPNTFANAIFVGYMLLQKTANFTTTPGPTGTWEFRSAGLFRGISGGSGGTGGGGGGGATSLAGLTDVSISSPTNGQPLTYNSTTTKWSNSSTITASLEGTASYANTVKPAGPTSSIQFNKDGIITGSTELTFQNNTLRIDSSETFNSPYIVVYNDGSNAQTIISSDAIITTTLQLQNSQLNVDGLLPNTFVYLPGGLSSKYLAASVNNITASTNGNITLSTIPTASFITSSNVYGPYGSNSILSASYAITSSYAATSSYASNFTVAGTLTAQTIIVQTITSSTDYVTGSTHFGTLLSNTHQFTGSVGITGSLNATASWAVSASQAISSSNATSASYAFASTSASYASASTSASYAFSSSNTINSVTSSYPITLNGTTIRSAYPVAGTNGSGGNNSIFLGSNAGLNATVAASNFLGNNAGSDATSAYQSNFLGNNAGNSAGKANDSNFLGASAGLSAGTASNSNFLGNNAGNSATNANDSNFFGQYAGASQLNASYSTFIGYKVANVSNIGSLFKLSSNNIIIGTNITLPANTANSINLGGVLFGTGTYSTTTGEPYSGSQHGTGKIGINIISPNYTLDVSGSGNFSNGLTVTGTLNAATITGSLHGTASWANNTITSSYPISVTGTSLYSIAPSAGVPSSTDSIFLGYLAGSGSLGNNLTFLGNSAGWKSSGSNNSNFLGNAAGKSSISAIYSNFLGASAGEQTSASYSNFLGLYAGFAATYVTQSNFLGYSAGQQAANANDSNFLGYYAGYAASSADNSNFLGYWAGKSATSANNSNFFGNQTGVGATGANNSNFFGNQAGNGATNAYYSNFIGYLAGFSATSAQYSNFIGRGAGWYAQGASYSTLIGFQAGYNGTNTIGTNNIIIGTNITLANNRKDSINLGGIIFATGSYSASLGSPYSGSQGGIGRVGINVVDPNYTLDVSGSGNFTNGLTVTGSVNIRTGSLTLSTGSVTMPNRPAFRVTGASSTDLTAVTTISGSAATVDYNQGGYYNSTTGVFTAPIAGLYHVYMNLRVGSANSQMQAIMYKNDTTVQLMWEAPGLAASSHFGVSGIVNLAANDNLRVKVAVGKIQFDGNDNWGAAYIG